VRDLSFFGIAAQVIPVLLIALGIEARAFARPRSWPEVFVYIFIVVYASLAEMLALLGVMEIRGLRNHVFNEWFVFSAIAVQMTMLVFVAMRPMVGGFWRHQTMRPQGGPLPLRDDENRS
jgi:hypothetical protein